MKRFAGILSVVLLILAGAAFAADSDGFTSLFDGKTLEGWDGNPDFWRVEDGTITGETTAEKPTKGNTFCIWRLGEVDDFELTFDYRFVSEWGNSGVQYRSFEVPDAKWVIGGYQADFDSANNYSGILYGERFRGIIGPRGQKSVIKPDPAVKNKIKVEAVEKFADNKELAKAIKGRNEWNSYRVVAKGFHFTHEINATLMSDVVDEDLGVRRRGGVLALQLHAGPPMKVQFKNIRLKRLPLEGAKKVVFVAGKASHGYMAHGHHPGCKLLAKMLNEAVPGLHCTVYLNGWPKDPTAFDNANEVVIFSDGGGGHPVCAHLAEMDALAKRGVNLACLHYAVEVPKGEPGDKLLGWIGGYFETDWSVNPHWTAEFKQFPNHPVTRGVKPFTVDDEWYYHMRFVPDMKGVTPVLTAIPPDSTRERPDGAHSNNPTVRAGKGQPEHVAWCYERPDGGRGFGFTGGHWHYNWANPGFRTIVLNAIVWTAGLEVPQGGVVVKTPTMEELEQNQDYPAPAKFDREKVLKLIEEWNAK